MEMSKVKIIETPRDGIQGIKKFIPTNNKIELIHTLLQVGFEGVEVGCFVSPKAIPQLIDTGELVDAINLQNTTSKIMVLAGNEKGARIALQYPQIDQVIFPFSLSEIFLKKNINIDLNEGWQRLMTIHEIVKGAGKELVPYLTMGFGNPYGDDWSIDLVVHEAGKLIETGMKIIPLSDITGEANPDKIFDVYSSLKKAFPRTEFGLHLHSSQDKLFNKLNAAWEAGCRRFDTVTGGLGGCPLTGKKLLTNLNTLDLISFLERKGINHGLDVGIVEKARHIILSKIAHPDDS